jgi:hypothetical protein
VVGEDLKMGTKEVGSPFLKCLNDGKEFLLVNRIILLSIVELIGVVGNWLYSLPSCTKVQHGTSVVVAGISGDIDVQCCVFIINYSETVSTENQVFDVFKGSLVLWSMVAFLGGEGHAHTHVFSGCR